MCPPFSNCHEIAYLFYLSFAHINQKCSGVGVSIIKFSTENSGYRTRVAKSVIMIHKVCDFYENPNIFYLFL